MTSGASVPTRRRRPHAMITALAAAVLALLPLPAEAAGSAGAATAAGAVAAAEAAGSAAASDAPSTDPAAFEQQVLFRSDSEQGYACFRIPAVVRTTGGTLLAFAEGRADNCGDAGDIDLVLKRSTDGGRTWGPLQIVNAGDGDTHGNPVPIVDRRTGRVVLLTTYNKGRTDSASCDTPCDRTEHVQYSDDDGATWSEPRDITGEIREPGWNSWYATGPVHGVQLSHGRHAGRLVLGVNAESWDGTRVTANHAALVHSDDGGASWHIGAVDTWPISAADGTFRQKPSELSLAERQDGSLYVSGREQDGTDLGNRTYAVSRDGGDTFAAPFRAVPDLYAPMVQGSVLSLGDGGSDRGRFLLSAPADPDRRRTMMIRSSWDEGRTWDGVDRGRVVTTDWSGYSDMVGIARGTVGLLYEGGAVDARDEIRFARFTDGWLGERRGPDPVTPDLAKDARPAAVLGGPRAVEGRFGGALEFDGTDDAVRLPYRNTLPLGTRDFTVSLWFRYTAMTGDQPFLWMGGVGSSAPQVWIRGEPAAGRIRALITTRDGSSPARNASVGTAQAYNDGQWHHVSLVRWDGTLTLTVDGTETASAPDVPGTVSRTTPFGVHLGQRMDSRVWFTGALDDVRVYGRALTGPELARIRGGAAVPDGGGALLQLPLDTVRPAG